MSNTLRANSRVITKSLFSNWAGLLVNVSVAFVLTPYIVSKLGIAIYGLWSFIIGIVGYLGLVDFGIRGSTGKFINYYMARDDIDGIHEIISTSFYILTLLAMLALFISIILGQYFTILFDKAPAELSSVIAIVIPVLVVNMWIAFINAILTNIITAFDRFELTNGITILSTLVRVVSVYYVLENDFGLLGLSIASLASSFIGVILSYFISIHLSTFFNISPFRFKKSRVKELWNFGLAVFFVRSSNQLVIQVNQFLLMIFLGPAAIGIYSIAYMLISHAQNIILQINNSYYPSIMKLGSVKNSVELNKIFLQVSKISFILGIPVFCGFIVFGHDFLLIWLGEEYIEVNDILILLSIGGLASISSSVARPVLFGLDKVRENVLATAFYAFIAIGCSMFFMLTIAKSVLSVAFAVLIASIISNVFVYPYVVSRSTGLSVKKYYVHTVLIFFIISLGTYLWFNSIAGLLDADNWLTFIMQVLCGIVGYSIFIYLSILPIKIKKIIRKKLGMNESFTQDK